MEKDTSFPHNSTADISYDAAQFKAYRDLGCILGLWVIDNDGHPDQVDLMKKEPNSDLRKNCL
jgi:hypothetical protein